MSQDKYIKKRDLLISSLTKCLTALILLCVYLGTLHLSGPYAGASSNEVFCPLQKTWVKRNPVAPATPKQREPLKNICARDERKADFASELFESLRLTRATPGAGETEQLFFAYFAEGKPALTGFVSSHNIPDPQFISSVRTEKGANGSKFEDAKQELQVLTLTLRPRPPTSTVENNFVSLTVTELKNISRRIKPRAPPVSI